MTGIVGGDGIDVDSDAGPEPTINVDLATNNPGLEFVDERGVNKLRAISQTQGSGVFQLNSQTVTADYTIPSNHNAVSAGPITINTGVTVTIGDTENWSIV